MAAYEVLLLNTAIPQIQAAQSGDTYVVPRDISFSAGLTLAAGTQNGVVYLNASRVATTGSALTFDGITLTNAGQTVFKNDGLISDGTNTVGRFYGLAAGVVWRGESGLYQRWDLGASERMRLSSDGTFRVKGNGTAGSTDAVQFSGSAPADAMRLDSSGRLLVATTSATTPASGASGGYLLEITKNQNAWTEVLVKNTDTNSAGQADYVAISDTTTVRFGAAGSGDAYQEASSGFVSVDGAYPLTFRTNNTERARITSGGILGVGCDPTTIWPSAVSSSGTNGSTYAKTYLSVSSNASILEYLNRNDGDGTITQYYRTGTAVGSVSVTSTATAYNTSSDYRLKDNQQPLTNSGAFIDALQPKTWNWKSDGTKGVGFIAHEVQAVSPSSVVGEKDAVDEDGKPVMQAMEYGSAEFIANIIAELQSLRARVAQLEQGA